MTGTTATITDNRIAIIGMSCRVPGARSVGEFWHNLVHAKEAITIWQDATGQESTNERRDYALDTPKIGRDVLDNRGVW